MTSGGLERPFLLRGGRDATGIVVCLHGRGIDARRTAWLIGIARLADEQGAAVVLPQAVDERGRPAETWEPERDLPHLAAVVASVRDELGGGPVCLAGISNGAWMACRYAAAHAGDVAALGAVAGLRAPVSAPARPVPVVAFHGLRDRAAPYAGGKSVRWQESVPDAARAWAVANRVDPTPAATAVGPTLERLAYGEGSAGEVALWTFAKAGHTWPGSRGDGRFVLQLFHGRISVELDATDEIWRFYARHRR